MFTGIGIILSFIWRDTPIGFLAFISGILCVLSAAKGIKWNYIIGIVNCIAYAWVSYNSGLFGEVMLNMVFYLPLQFIGFYFWNKKTKDDGIVEMKKMSKLNSLLILAISIIFVYLYGLFLGSLDGQVTPFVDSFTNVISIVAAILMLKRLREYWILYIAVNTVSVFMWSLRFIGGNQDSLTMIIMWSAYLVNSVYGTYVWYKSTERKNVLC